VEKVCKDVNKFQLEPYKDYVQPFYSEKDPAHNFQHIERIIQRLPVLANRLSAPPRTDRLYFLACFHGLGKRLQTDGDFRTQTKKFLMGLGWTVKEICELFESLARQFSHPETVEEEIVHDANYLETTGAFGIAKAFTTGGAKGQSMEETVNIFEGQYFDRVEFRTPEGKRIAGERKVYTQDFFERLRKEW